MFQREILEVEGLARPDADRSESRPDILVFPRRWDELEGGVEILVVVRLDSLSSGREEIDLRRCRRRWLLEERGKGCALYPACTFSTFGMSAGLKSWVRKTTIEKGVVEEKTFLIPAGVSPFQSGPTTR